MTHAASASLKSRPPGVRGSHPRAIFGILLVHGRAASRATSAAAPYTVTSARPPQRLRRAVRGRVRAARTRPQSDGARPAAHPPPGDTPQHARAMPLRAALLLASLCLAMSTLSARASAIAPLVGVDNGGREVETLTRTRLRGSIRTSQPLAEGLPADVRSAMGVPLGVTVASLAGAGAGGRAQAPSAAAFAAPAPAPAATLGMAECTKPGALVSLGLAATSLAAGIYFAYLAVMPSAPALPWEAKGAEGAEGGDAAGSAAALAGAAALAA
jgi:hypothetical protein